MQICFTVLQRFFGTAVGKGRQAAKTEIERLNLKELTCEQGVVEVAKMYASISCPLGLDNSGPEDHGVS
jgi:hypothetical protein